MDQADGGFDGFGVFAVGHAVVAQLRGNAIIERFLDMNRSAGIPDYALPANANKNAETLYRFRILSNQEFNP